MVFEDLPLLWAPVGSERVGFILEDGELVEVENVCPEPEEGFEVRGEDLVEYAERAVASWHTHPGASANLSTDDYIGFVNHPKLKHYIVGSDGVRAYVVKGNKVLNADG